MKKRLAFLAACVGMSVPMMAAEVTLPDIGFSITDYLTAAVGQIGDPLKIVVGAIFVLAVVWLGIKWFRKAK